MTAAPATPQVMRDRLLQAIDDQSNIRNMVAVVEVISYLETYPITKEALEETRLGKLINDVRKKTKNEDLARRAKKLLRSWQKLIEPVKGELLSKGLACSSWSSKASANSCAPTVTPLSAKTGPELKSKNGFNNCSPKGEKPNNRKCTSDQKEGQLLPTKIPKTALNDKIQNLRKLPTNGLGGTAEVLTNICAHHPLEKEIPEPLDNKKINKVPVHAVKPHPSGPGCSKLPSTSSLLKASLRQQQARPDRAASHGQRQPRSPHSSSGSPRTPKQEAVAKHPAAQAQVTPGAGARVGIAGTSEFGVSDQPFGECRRVTQTDCSRPANVDSQSRIFSASTENANSSPCSDVVALDGERSASNAEKGKRQKYRPKDYVVNLDGHVGEDGTRQVRPKDRRLTFDPVTGQIKSSSHKDSSQEGEVALDLRHEQLGHKQSIPPSPFHQTDWKELSRSEIIQSYLSQQSNVLTSSGAHAPGAHFFMTEFMKREEHEIKDVKKTHILAISERPPKELPGISRDVSSEDLCRLHTEQWSGVNGCYDTKGNWYDWTECISLDPHGDECRLNILPYVCLD